MQIKSGCVCILFRVKNETESRWGTIARSENLFLCKVEYACTFVRPKTRDIARCFASSSPRTIWVSEKLIGSWCRVLEHSQCYDGLLLWIESNELILQSNIPANFISRETTTTTTAASAVATTIICWPDLIDNSDSLHWIWIYELRQIT